MSAKGWVERKREQFELFAKTEQEHRRPVSPIIQEPARIISISHKPQQVGDTQEVTSYI